jgi:predicted SAM-dependent methyltransferase
MNLKTVDKPICLNLGCGSVFNSSWRNLDIDPVLKSVEKWHAQEGIPASSGSIDVVYHSHLLEHLKKEDGERLLKESFRVLKPNGILRIAVPDLEQICVAYLDSISRIEAKVKFAGLDAEWMRLELLDQMTRSYSGGRMADYIEMSPQNKSFIIKRTGEQFKHILEEVICKQEKIPMLCIPWHLRTKQFLRKLICTSFWKETIQNIILGEYDYKALKYGRFYFSGELHKHMYDRISLEALLNKVGFNKINKETHLSSLIENWPDYQLDTTKSGNPRKPDSLYMEASKF